VPFANWSRLLRELEAELAVGSLAAAPAPEAPGPDTLRPPPPSPPFRLPGQPPASGRFAPSRSASPPGFAAGQDGSAGLDMDPESLELDRAPHAAAGPRRPPEAAEAFRQALEELAAGREVSALALLRRALALAPGDLEIARKVGEVASGRG
jgi:hypothetical protein